MGVELYMRNLVLTADADGSVADGVGVGVCGLGRAVKNAPVNIQFKFLLTIHIRVAVEEGFGDSDNMVSVHVVDTASTEANFEPCS